MSRPPTPIENRFWTKVKKTDSCWVWTASVNNKGYGVLGLPGKHGIIMYAHRFSYELHLGPIKKGLNVCHKCDNPRCVNPDHLFLGTQRENMDDCIRKRRLAVGERHSQAKLTANDVRAIRKDTRPQKEIAKDYGVLVGHISIIQNHHIWKSVD